MKIATYNLNGIRSAINKGWMEWLKQMDLDIICVQELKAQDEQIDFDAF
ncbi:MAG TPA: exodeoxyribonuclease III, partial [Bacteroidetes bacterium]|nr:exodeoxyribonuclease III [Bacteroidota bacterium]